MRPFLATVVVGCGFFSALIFYADTAHRWHRKPIFAARPIPSGHVWVLPFSHVSSFDIRLLRIAQIASTEHPDFILIAGSRGGIIQEDMFPKGVRFLNLSVEGAAIEDFVGLWQALKDMRKIPPCVIVFLDPWEFSENFGFTFWYANISYIEEFQPGRFSLSEKEDAILISLREFFSFDALRAAVKYLLFEQRQEQESRDHIVPEDQQPSHWPAMRWDGVLSWGIPPPKQSALQLQKAIEEWAARMARDPSSFKRLKLDKNTIQLARAMLEDMSKQTHVIVVSPPFPRATSQVYSEFPIFSAGMSEYHQVITRFISELPNVTFINTNSDALGCAEEDFVDVIHMALTCAKKLISNLISQKSTQTILKKLPKSNKPISFKRLEN